MKPNQSFHHLPVWNIGVELSWSSWRIIPVRNCLVTRSVGDLLEAMQGLGVEAYERRIIPGLVSVVRITPVDMPFRPFGRRTAQSLGYLRSPWLLTTYELKDPILQAGGSNSKIFFWEFSPRELRGDDDDPIWLFLDGLVQPPITLW